MDRPVILGVFAHLAENPALVEQHRVDFLVDVSAYVDRKVAAMRAHRTQHLSIGPFMLDRPNRSERLQWETFDLVEEPPPLHVTAVSLTFFDFHLYPYGWGVYNRHAYTQ